MSTDKNVKGNDPLDSEAGSNKIKLETAGVTLTMKPLNIKRLRKLMTIVNAALDKLGGMDKITTLESMFNIVIDNFGEIVKVFFPIEEYPIVKDDFIEEHIDIPTARKILDKAIEINGLSDIYPMLKKISGKGGTA